MTRPRLDAHQLVRPEVRALRAYQLDGRPVRFRLDQSEMPWEWPRRVRQRIAERLLEAPWSCYPDGQQEALAGALARRYGWPADGILTGNGSDDLLTTTFAALAGPGRDVLALAPGFAMHGLYALRAGARVHWLGPREDLSLPLDELRAELAADAKRPVLLTSPNNPTGEAIPPAVVADLAARLDAPLLLDNAYAEFCRYDYLPLLAQHPNLVIFRTFSKAWALAGLRVGYLLCQPALAAEINKVRLPYTLGFPGALAVRVLLEEERTFRCRVRGVLRLREAWRQRLEQAGLEVLPSDANFFLVRVPGPPSEAHRVYQGLLGRGLRVRDFSSAPGLTGCLRISVGSAQALREVGQGLAELLGYGGKAP